MTSVTRTERGWGGHFVGAANCRFRRNTLLELGDVRVVVSTVGAYVPRSARDYEELGFERHYETMAFHAEWEPPYWDADVSREIRFSSPWALHGVERDSDARANDMHEAVVTEIADKMERGKEMGEQ